MESVPNPACITERLMVALLRRALYCLSTEQSKTLFVRGLSEDTTEETLRESFEGSISARIVTDRDTGSSKGYVKHDLGFRSSSMLLFANC